MYSTLPPSSCQPNQKFSNLPSVNTFGDLSNFLRSAIADEDSRIFSDSMAQLALHAEGVMAGLRLSRKRDHVAPLLMDMLTVLREHRGLVLGLGLSWRGLYEYAAYLQALNNFRVLIGQWLLHTSPWDDQLTVTAEEFALVAWRTMGEGMLLVDMYEQWLLREENDSDLGELREPQLEQLFATQGQVDSVRLIRDQMTGRSRGFAFVEMTDEEQGRAPTCREVATRMPTFHERDRISDHRIGYTAYNLDLALAGVPNRPVCIYEAQHVVTLLGLVEAGLGVAAVPRLAKPGSDHPTLVSVPLKDPQVTRRLGLIRRRGRSLSPAAQHLYAMFAELKKKRAPRKKASAS